MGSSGEAPQISILLPTRGRPEMARAFLSSLADTADFPSDIEVVLFTDKDDPLSATVTEPRLRVITIVGRDETMGSMNTACLQRASGAIVMLGNDDVLVRTSGWDTALRGVDARFADGVYLAWPNDGVASWRMSTFPVLSRRAADLLVDPFPREYRRAFIDYDLFDIFTRLRRMGHDRLVYLRDVHFDHHHHRTGKRAADETSRRSLRFGDDPVFLARTASRQHQAARLAAAIAGVPPAAHNPNSQVALIDRPLAAFARFAKVFLRDGGLPVARRVHLFLWYCGRYLASKLTGSHSLLLP